MRKCLDKISYGIQAVGDYEVIVTDDSKENVARLLVEENYNWVKWVEGTKKGPAANRNNGAKNAKGDWLIFIDDDCEPSPGLIQAYLNSIKENPSIKVFEGAIHADRKRLRFDEESPVNVNGGYLFSCNFAIEKNYFTRLKGFDENFPFPAMEDTELAYRIKQDNTSFLFLKHALVVHPWRRKKSIIKTNLKRFNAALYFIKKHPEEKNNFGFRYYLTAFAHSTVSTLKHALKFRLKGMDKQMVHDAMLLYFAVYMLFKNK